MAVEFENSEELFSTQIGNIGLTAAAFDYFGLAEVIELCAGKTGSHVKVKQSEVVKLMCCQVLNVPYQSLYGTEEFYQEKPIQGLTGNSTISSHDLNRDVLSRALDAIAEYGPERLFLKCAKAVSSKLGLKPDTVHLDSTSFHYEGRTREEEGCNLVLDPGYSRDSHPELNQINELMVCDELSRLPLFATCVSGHTSDKTSFRNIIIDYWKLIKQQFSELRYLVGDSALCTSEIAMTAARNGIYFVSRIPDKNGEAVSCFEKLKATPQSLVPVDKDEPDGPKAMWCGEGVIGKQKVRKLLVQNELLTGRKTETVNKKAEKELEAVLKALKKFEIHPCKCMADAEKQVTELTSKLKLVSVSDITYEEVKGYKSKGRPKKDEEKVTVSVIVRANAQIDTEAVKDTVEKATYYVLCTNDTERKWTMSDLLSTYKKQSVVERNWKYLKDRKILVGALFLESPSRINALMWLMTLALLIFSATEYLMRKKMAENKLSIPSPDHRTELTRPSMMRVYQYLSNSSICLTYIPGSEFVKLTGVPKDMQKILLSMGEEWCRYYVSSTYKTFICTEV